MKLAYLLDRFPVLSESFIRREIEALSSLGAEPVVFALRPGDGAEGMSAIYLPDSLSGRAILPNAGAMLSPGSRYTETMMRTLALASREVRSLPGEAWHLFRAAWLAGELRSRGIEHLHAHFGGVPSTVAWAAARMSGIGFSISVHARDIFVQQSCFPEKLLAARRVIACTEYARRYLLTRYPELDPGRVLTVHHGLDIGENAFAGPPPEGRFTVLAVGRLVPKKGFDSLLRAVASIEGLSLRIVGDGPERGRLKGLAGSLGLLGRTEFTGAANPEGVRAALAASHVLAAPSVIASDGDRDGLPNVVLEAMAAGRPVVGSRLSGIPEVVEDGVTGLLVPPGDAGALAQAISRLRADSDAAQRMGAEGRRTVERRFSLDSAGRRMLAALEEAAKGH